MFYTLTKAEQPPLLAMNCQDFNFRTVLIR